MHSCRAMLLILEGVHNENANGDGLLKGVGCSQTDLHALLAPLPNVSCHENRPFWLSPLGLPRGLARPFSYSHLLLRPTLALGFLVGVDTFPAASNSPMLSGELRVDA